MDQQQYRRVQCSQCRTNAVCRIAETSFQCRRCHFENVVWPEVAVPPPAPVLAPAFDDEDAGESVPTPPAATWSVFAKVAMIAVGAVTGCAIALGLSLAKSDLGTGGLVGVLILGFLTLAVLIGVRVFAGVSSANPESTWPQPAIHWSAAGLMVGGACFVPCFAVVAAEAFGPPEGFVQRSMNRAEDRERKEARDAEERERLAKLAAEEPERERRREAERVQRAKEEQDETARKAREDGLAKAWESADVILVSPGSRAVALRSSRDTKKAEFTLLNAAQNSEVSSALTKAWAAKVPMIADPDLARQIAEKVAAGQKVSIQDADQVDRRVRFRPVLPVKLPLVTFKDKLSNQSRFGHLAGTMDDSFTFVKLLPRRDYSSGADALPYQTETLSRSSVANYRTITEDELGRSADRLDYMLYRAMSELQAKAGVDSADSWQVRPHIYVDDVYVRESVQSDLVREIQAQIRSLKADKLSRLQNPTEAARLNSIEGTGLIPALAVILGDYLNELRRAREAKSRDEAAQRLIDEEIREQEERLDQVKRLGQAGVELKEDLHKRFTEMGIPVPDRSARTASCYLKLDPKGTEWVGTRPGASEAFRSGMDQASHILLADISPPRGTGSYHLAMRLVDFRTGSIVWSDNGDREVFAGNPFIPNGTPPIPLSGVWKCAGNPMSLRVTEKDRDITFKMIAPGAEFTEFEILGKRNGNAIKVTTCFVVYQPQLKMAAGNHPRRAEVVIVNDKKIIVKAQTDQGRTRDGKPILSIPLAEMIFEKK